MLTHLEIRDFAIVDHATVEFAPGLNVLTGETGAGKSILIDALEFLTGGRANQMLIRTGAQKTQVQAEFSLEKLPHITEYLNNNSFFPDNNTLVVSREFHTSGRSVSRVNGTSVSLSAVKELTERLIDLHGQHEHQTLLKQSMQLDLLDASCHNITALRNQVSLLVNKQNDLKKELETISGLNFEKELDFLRFQLAELEEAKLLPGEDKELKEEQNRLHHLEELCNNAVSFENLMEGEDSPGAMSNMTEIIRLVSEINKYEPKVNEWKERLSEIKIEFEELRHTISNIKNEAEPDPERLEYITGRLDLIEKLKRKYGAAIDDVLVEKEKIKAKIDEFAGRETKLIHIKEKITSLSGEIQTICTELSIARINQADILSEQVNKEINDLSIGLNFRINITPSERVTERGKDSAEFQIRASSSDNEGAWAPLVKVASGGELSRLMLALKVVLAKADKIPILIYDEIDTGLGGKAAFVVSDKLVSLGESHQVLCVTHLHQIAAKAINHCLVTKEAKDNSIKVNIVSLANEERIYEIARMVGGDQATEPVIQHAKELLAANKITS